MKTIPRSRYSGQVGEDVKMNCEPSIESVCDDEPLIGSCSRVECSDLRDHVELKRDKLEKRRLQNKKVRKRIRRVLRNTWKWFQQGCKGLTPTVSGFGVIMVPVFNSYKP